MGGLGIIIFCLLFLGLLGVLFIALIISIIKKNKIGLGISISCLLYLLYWMFGSPFNMWGLLTKEPEPVDLVAKYELNEGRTTAYVSRMGYKKLSGFITLNSDMTFEAKDIPACCVHGADENYEPFSGGYYSFSGTWRIGKSSAVYVVDLSILKIEGENVPTDAELNKFFLSRVPHSNLKLNIMKGQPLSLVFSVFYGDFYDIEFAKK